MASNSAQLQFQRITKPILLKNKTKKQKNVNPWEMTKFIAQNEKDIVYGYLRRCQQLLSITQSYQIGELIQLTILLFYVIVDLIPPKLKIKRIIHSYIQSQQRMALSAEVQWTIPDRIIGLYPLHTNTFTFDIRENLQFKSYKYVARVTDNQTWETLAPLEVDTEYEFQINMFCEGRLPSLETSKWSKPLRICTPQPPKSLPIPNYLQVTMLLPNIMELKWDPGFAPYRNDTVYYIIKEYLQFSQHPFVARYQQPLGKLTPLEPNTTYQFTVYTSRNDIDSVESAPIQVRTPSQDFHLMDNYKPLPPNNIQQIYDKENNEIVLMWQLPQHTYGEKIYYQILDYPGQDIITWHELPVRIPTPEHNVDIRIITVSEMDVNNETTIKYQSDATTVQLISRPRGLVPTDAKEDESLDDATILVRVFINKQYELTKDIDPSQDIWKLVELDKSYIDINSIPIAFRRAKWIKHIFKNKQYIWKIFSYDLSKADIEIQLDDDLQEEIDEFIDDDQDSSRQYLKLRVVFFKEELNQVSTVKPAIVNNINHN